MTVVLDHKPKAERSLTETDARTTAEAAAPDTVWDLLDDNGSRWRAIGDGRLWPVSPGGRVDRLVTVPVAAVEMLCGPLRQVKAVTR